MFKEVVEFAQIRAQAIKDLVPELNELNGKLLDFGCGDGLLTNYLQAVFFQATVTGVDQSVELITQACEQFPEIEFKEIKGKQVPFMDNTFEGVITSLVLHHIDRDEHAFWIKEMMRVLKPNGLLIVQELNPYNLFAYLRFKRDPEEKNARMLSPYYVHKLLNEFGIKITPLYRKIPFTEMYTFVWKKIN